MTRSKKTTVKNYEALVEELIKEKGTDSVSWASEKKPTERISTGLLSLDKILGGGIPRGKITEIYGVESSGKTLILSSIIAEAQKENGICVLIDTERTFDAEWAAKNGVVLDKLLIIEPDTGEETWDICEKLVVSGDVDVIGLDSIANVIPKAEIDGEMGDANIGLAARLNARSMRKLTNHLGHKNKRTALVFINQIRSKVQSMGNPNTTTGGRAIPFYASLRMNMARIAKVGSGESVSGGTFRVKLEKAKVTGIKPFAVCMFDVDFDTGLDKAKDVLVHAVVLGKIKKKGSWYYLDGLEEPLQGEAAVKEYIRTNGLIDKWITELR